MEHYILLLVIYLSFFYSLIFIYLLTILLSIFVIYLSLLLIATSLIILLNNYLLICSLITLKIYLVHATISLLLLLTKLCFSSGFFSCHYYSFKYIREIQTFPIDTTHCDIELAFDLIFLIFHGLHFATTLTVWSLCYVFIWLHLIMVQKGVRDVDSACRCHQSNIMPDSIFSVNIAQWVPCGLICLFVFVLFCFMCVLQGDILGSFFW